MKFEKYVEVVAGSHFEIRTRVNPVFYFGDEKSLATDIYLSGEYASGTPHEEDLDYPVGFDYISRRGVVIGNRKSSKRFKFANITTRQWNTASFLLSC